MRWPLVSARWYDAYLAERAEVRRLTDALTRIERAREGLPELAPEKRKPQEPMPGDLVMLIERMWAGDHSRKAEEKRARQLFAKHGDWQIVKGLMMEPQAEEVVLE